VPGIGPAAKEKLADKGITTTFGLIRQFLLLKEEGVGPLSIVTDFGID
jgi:predicted RecB family nuclease